MKKGIFIVIVLIIFLSGCNGTEYVIPDVSVQRDSSSPSSSTDVVQIDNLESYPKSPVMPSTTFYINYNIKSLSDTKTIQNVETDIWDACLYDITERDTEVFNLYPESEKEISFKLTAPSQNEIANVKYSCDIGVYVDYTFNSSTLYDVVVMNMDNIIKVQKSEKDVDITARNYKSDGPVQIDVSLSQGDSEPIVVDDTSELKLPLKLELNNIGSGSLKDNSIPAGQVSVLIPSEMVSSVDSELSTGGFSCGGSTTLNGKSYIKCINGEEIEFYSDESSPIILYLNFNENTSEFYRTFTIVANAEYEYEITKRKTVETIPYSV